MAARLWPEPWRAVTEPDEALSLLIALERELSLGHSLQGRAVVALGRRDDCDGVLFAIGQGEVAEVHLTWKPQDDPRFPWTHTFNSFEAWAAKVSEG